MAAHDTPCPGPLTHAGCGAICRSYDRGCYGCHGPKEASNAGSLSAWFGGMIVSEPELAQICRTFNAWAPAFREESEAHDR
jgi:sulfhydrogenase subunit delta